MTVAMELSSASKSFGAVKAVNNVSLSVQAGEVRQKNEARDGQRSARGVRTAP